MSNWDAANWDSFFWNTSNGVAQSRAQVRQAMQSRSFVVYQFLSGNELQFSWQVNDANGWIDPENVQLQLKPPTGAVVVLEPEQASAGHYQATWSTEGQLAGKWIYRWSGDGVAEEGTFEVKASQL